MLAVIDTNVLVSASINREGVPGKLVARIRTLELTPVVSAAILDEYAEVLRRPRFNFPQDWVDDLLADMEALALHVRPAKIDTSNLPDPSDAPFIATALAAGCPIVTGNARHFPADCGVEILSPAQCRSRLIG
ncbi:MAG: putative toxin-antitoxin system toxin component, PIN family [Gammaproteobacteria bacterium]|nr:putative toxin-antitoxin system toxin component, PIN family [Gammaproteobacteria bacterium]